MEDIKKAASGAGNTTDSKSNQSTKSVAQQSSEVKRRILLLYPCDTCGCRDRCTDYQYCGCPAFGSWAKMAWYWTTRFWRAEVRQSD